MCRGRTRKAVCRVSANSDDSDAHRRPHLGHEARPSRHYLTSAIQRYQHRLQIVNATTVESGASNGRRWTPCSQLIHRPFRVLGSSAFSQLPSMHAVTSPNQASGNRAGVLEEIFAKKARDHARGGRRFRERRRFLEGDVSRIGANRNVIHASALDALRVAEAQVDPFCPAQVHRQARHQQVIVRGDRAWHGLTGHEVVLAHAPPGLFGVTDEVFPKDDPQRP